MLTRIQKEFTFQTAVHFEGSFMVNFYEMLALIDVETLDPKEQNVAIERMTFFLSQQIENVIFVNEKEVEAIKKYREAGIKVAEVPDEPYDQIVGLVLINKCNSIMEGRLYVNEIIFGSKLSNLIKFSISGESAEAEFPGKFWYNDNSPNVSAKNKKDKIVKLFDDHQTSWKELELTWKAK